MARRLTWLDWEGQAQKTRSMAVIIAQQKHNAEVGARFIAANPLRVAAKKIQDEKVAARRKHAQERAPYKRGKK